MLHIKGQLIALATNTRLGLRASPETNPLAYFAGASVTKKKIFTASTARWNYNVRPQSLRVLINNC